MGALPLRSSIFAYAVLNAPSHHLSVVGLDGAGLTMRGFGKSSSQTIVFDDVCR